MDQTFEAFFPLVFLLFLYVSKVNNRYSGQKLSGPESLLKRSFLLKRLMPHCSWTMALSNVQCIGAEEGYQYPWNLGRTRSVLGFLVVSAKLKRSPLNRSLTVFRNKSKPTFWAWNLFICKVFFLQLFRKKKSWFKRN